MPAFELERVDGGDPVDVPKGSTVLGRGPYLGVSDKRVSRTHAVLENWDGQLRLKPTHTNPCFIQASLEALPQPLEKDQWHCLREGSTFSLLPGKYIYKVFEVIISFNCSFRHCVTDSLSICLILGSLVDWPSEVPQTPSWHRSDWTD
uniref:PNK FHA domain-containing protein n=1 Tax=Electrophorus electricus TaxID=8005 RepID=A0AAY5F0A2_ELEEL